VSETSVALVRVQQPTKPIPNCRCKPLTTLLIIHDTLRLEGLLDALPVQDLLAIQLSLLQDHASPLGQVHRVHENVSSWGIGHRDRIDITFLIDPLLGVVKGSGVVRQREVGLFSHLRLRESGTLQTEWLKNLALDQLGVRRSSDIGGGFSCDGVHDVVVVDKGGHLGCRQVEVSQLLDEFSGRLAVPVPRRVNCGDGLYVIEKMRQEVSFGQVYLHECDAKISKNYAHRQKKAEYELTVRWDNRSAKVN